jgi:hypothetical protein
MRLGEARDAIVAALNAATIPGVTAQPMPPEVHQPGMAYPVWRSSVPLASGAEATFDLFVVLPAGSPAATIDAADPIVDDVADALLGVGVVTLYGPVTLATDMSGSAELPALRFTLTTI